MKFSIKDFFSKCLLRICSHLLKKLLIKNFIFCTMLIKCGITTKKFIQNKSCSLFLLLQISKECCYPLLTHYWSKITPIFVKIWPNRYHITLSTLHKIREILWFLWARLILFLCLKYAKVWVSSEWLFPYNTEKYGSEEITYSVIFYAVGLSFCFCFLIINTLNAKINWYDLNLFDSKFDIYWGILRKYIRFQ